MRETMTLAMPDKSREHQQPINILRDWTLEPATKVAFARMARNLKEIILNDVMILLPQQGRVSPSYWREDYRNRFSESIEVLFRLEFPSLSPRLSNNLIRTIADENIWSEIEPWLEEFFIRALAASWAHDKLGDRVTVEQPIHEGSVWRVPIGLPQRTNLGRVTLDEEGNVLPTYSTTKEELLRTIRDAA